MIKEKLGKKIKEYRQQKGDSQEKLAASTGLNRTYIASVENGKRNISIENINKIAKGLDIRIEKLFVSETEPDYYFLIIINSIIFLIKTEDPLDNRLYQSFANNIISWSKNNYKNPYELVEIIKQYFKASKVTCLPVMANIIVNVTPEGYTKWRINRNNLEIKP